MVQRNLARPHRFVCFTDDSSGIDPRVEIQPLPEVRLPDGPERGWRKLGTFSARLGDLSGPTLFLDLDIVILDSIDCFFDLPGDFCIIHDWLRRSRITGNSSVYRFVVGRHTDVLEHFVKNRSQVLERHRNEQEYLTHQIHQAGQLTYWPADWCRSFKRKCIPVFPLNLFRTPAMPRGCRILVFHGFPHPDQALTGYQRGPLHRWCRPTPWLSDYWCE